MKISFKRMLALVLCAAMVFGMLPMQQVKADDLHQFTTMDDLRELANATYEELTYAVFMGTEFVFESIELSDKLVLNMPEANVTIPAGVNVKLGTIQCVNLMVEGTLDARQVEPRDSITVSGSMGVRDHFLLDLDTQLVGMENITRAISCQFWREGSASTAEELKAALARAESATDDATYSIWLSGDGITLEQDLAIPSNFRLYVNAPLTVGALNLDGALVIQEAGSVNVRGDLLFGPYSGVSGGAKLTVENGMAQRVFLAASSVELLRAGNRAAHPVWEGATDIIEVTDTFVLEHDVTIPAGCTLRVPVPFTIGEGVTMAVSGNMEVVAGMSNQGTLNNNGNVTVYGNAGGSLAFAPTGKYTGSGEMMVINSTYEDIIPGMDLSKVNIEQGQGIGGIRWYITAKEDAELAPGPDGAYHITTFAELQQLATMDIKTWTVAVYDGDETFVFDNITLPEDLALEFIGSSVVIPEGVTVNASNLFTSWLTVDGTLNSKVVTADEKLVVNGSLVIENGISLRQHTVLAGEENIVLTADWIQIKRNCEIASLEELEAAIAAAAACNESKTVYEFYMNNEMELAKDYTIPANANFRLRAPVTIAQGATLTLNGDNNDIFATLFVNGTLVNNGFVDYEYDGGGLLDFTQGGTYAGTGRLWIPAGTLTDETFLDAFPGWMPSGYRVINEENGWSMEYIKYHNLSFSNFAEMKELAKETYDEYAEIRYVGEGPLVIEENISFDGQAVILAIGKEIRVPQGVTANVWQFRCDSLIVEGAVNCRFIDATTKLEVTGSAKAEGSISVEEETLIIGRENISGHISRYIRIRDEAHLHRALELAAASTDSDMIFGIDFNNPDGVTLTQSVTLPGNTYWMVDAPLTVAEGATLTVESNSGEIMGAVEVRGHLVVNTYTQMYCSWGGSITSVNGGTYASDDELWLLYVEGDPLAYMTGFNLTGYVLYETGNSATWMIAPEGYNPGGSGGNDELEFANMEELKELASQTYENWTWAHYTGSGTLVIDESIVIPENLPFECPSLEIAAGVTVNAPHINADKLVVNGTLNVGNLNAYSEVTVNGSMLARGTIYIQEDTVLNGQDKIRFANDWAKISIRYFDNDLQGVKELFVQAEQETNPRIEYRIYLDQGEAVVAEDLTVSSNSSNVYFYIQTPLTVQEGVTLTFNNSQVWAHAPVTVKGNLENNTWLYVAAYNGATLTFAEGSSYSGGGTIAVEKDPSVSLESVLPGLDLSNLFVTQDGDWWWYVTTEPFNPGGGGYELSFASVEELKELASQTYDNWITATYTGNGPLVIDETIVCPEYLMIHAWEGTIQITENGSLSVDDVYCDTLIIEGVLNSNYVVVITEVDITGTLNLSGTLNIDEVTDLNGWNNIRFLKNWACVDCDYQNVDKERMLELVEAAYASTNSRWIYSIYPDTEGQIILDQDLTLPENTTFHLNMPMTVAEGCTLTLNCKDASLFSQLTVEGNLINNTWTELHYEEGGLLTIAEGGSYSGSGTICIMANYMEDPSVAVPGLDLSQWEIQQDGDWWYIRTIGGGGDNLTFSTLEELKALADESYDWGYMVYTGSEDFVISEDISLPVNTYEDYNGVNLIINEGTTAAFCQMNCEDLTVNGNLIAEYVEAMGDVVVRGTIKTMGLNIGEESEITGLENIKFTNSYNPLSRTYFAGTGEELVAALNKAANPKLPKEFANIQLNGGPVILTEDATLPKNCELYISNDMVIDEGATLTINGYVSIGCPLVVQGTLVNNYDIYTWDSKMIIAQGGKYEGRGTLRVVGGSDYKTAFRGLNLEDFQITNNYGEWHLVYVVGLPPVAAPSELEWGYTYDDGVKVALPGAVSWKSGITDTTGMEYVYFYRINEDGTETLMNEFGGVGYDAKNYMDGYNSSVELLLSDIPSGKYYFTVYSQGDYKNTRDSETVTSPVWEYTKPTDRLETATDLGWSDEVFRAEWTNPNNVEEVHYTLVSWYYKNSENGYEYTFGRFIAQEDEAYELTDFYLSMMGTGYYSYEVQFISADITKTLSSELSERSDWYHLEKMPETPTAQLGGLLNDPDKSNEEKLEEVQNMGTDTLKEIIEEVANAMEILVQLENIVAGGTAQVDVSAEVVEEIAELVVEEISIVGANLNSKVDEDLGVTLVIDKVEEVREITGNYDTSTAVQFSMTLDNVKDTKNLEVPVVVTIPVPAGIAADKVVVLHYHDDGTYDVINPEVTILGGKTYATFILTSFSDFAILEKLAALLGDVDLNEGVDVDDVLALLWAVLFPDMYSVEVEADFDHNGSVDVDDVLTLLWYVLFPDMYPLS